MSNNYQRMINDIDDEISELYEQLEELMMGSDRYEEIELEIEALEELKESWESK